MNIILLGSTTSADAFALLDTIHAQRPITKVLSSGRPGAPTYAVRWAIKQHLPRILLPKNDSALLQKGPNLALYFDLDDRDMTFLEALKTRGIPCHHPT
jgi:hypothetical protein